MSAATDQARVVLDTRAWCRGVLPLSARLERWQHELCRQPDLLSAWLRLHGSPLNIIDPAPLGRNAAELEQVAARHRVDFKMFFARKANKALALVDEATRLGLGVDLASERELSQALERGVSASELVMTAAVKPAPLLELCITSGTTVVLDNDDELGLLAGLAQASGQPAPPIALRLAPELGEERPQTRFGFGSPDALATLDRSERSGVRQLKVSGVHFHLDGYDAAERVMAIGQALTLIDGLRERGHEPTFIDIGGGIPISYLDSEAQWSEFWREHRRSLLGRREPLTFETHGLGLIAHGEQILGRPNVYPYHQKLTRGPWLEQVLSAAIELPRESGSVAQAIRTRGLQLRCEPGRSLLDGCGLTAARVEFRKQRRDGTWLIGLAMNRTQCRSTSEDFLLDPLLVRPASGSGDGDLAAGNSGPIEGYLVGAYCIERELLSWRKLRFPLGVQVGDIVVFVNTAGYLMHILESSSHQIPLARNLILGSDRRPFLDPIDSLRPR